MEIFKWLDDKSLVAAYTINDFRELSESYYLNLEIRFKDDSILYVKEFIEPTRRKYAFHWQKKTGELIVRWDNAPHFPQLSTFPHHKHFGNGSVEESTDISIEDVLMYIQKALKTY
ncbi:DUF6516 family protein [Dyadobacter sp. CY326]|uniref:toxin-antitoxin system TumE family protein n=1 Tax=Dyadobacter sp. CY326 TaxID=2907300 RepID=UPI001F235E25|nr:DUF6516 family protein [Dyadobacter sp. CY326]MCE7063674.1 DUF6516 family protein [Dyadobacter sp. CY326]